MDFDTKDTELVKKFYNNVENLDSEFRKNVSRIKGLRAFNNWVKCALIHKFAVAADSQSSTGEQSLLSSMINREGLDSQGLRVLEIGCGKGGDLHKWHTAPEKVAIYVGLDPADVSIKQAQERWKGYQKTLKYGTALSRAEYYTQDCFGESIKSIPAIKEVGFRHEAGGEGGFDIASMMFCMHYAFENETKVRMMLENITSALKKGGKLIGCVPNSNVIGEKIREFHEAHKGDDLGKNQKAAVWGNDIHNIRFPGKSPVDGIFDRPFGDKYFFTLAEAVEAPEYVVPWEIFCALAEEYNLKLQYCKSFDKVWAEEKDDDVLAHLSEEMGVKDKNGLLLVRPQEMEAAKFYVAFAFQKV